MKEQEPKKPLSPLLFYIGFLMGMSGMGFAVAGIVVIANEFGSSQFTTTRMLISVGYFAVAWAAFVAVAKISKAGPVDPASAAFPPQEPVVPNRDNEPPDLEVQCGSGFVREVVRRLLICCGAILALVGNLLLAWEVLVRQNQPGETFHWTEMLLGAGLVVLANLAFTGAGKLGDQNASKWMKGTGTACLAIFIWSNVNHRKESQLRSAPSPESRQYFRQLQERQSQPGTAPVSK